MSRRAETRDGFARHDNMKLSEKELMRGLNGRLAGFIDKVRRLEQHNRLLESEVEEVRARAKPASRLHEEYGPELRTLRQTVQDLGREKSRIELEHRTLEEELSDLRRRHEREARGRSDAESDVEALKRDISDAHQAKLRLDKRAQALAEEIRFLKQNHEAEVSEVSEQIRGLQVTGQAHEFGSPGVTAALRDIRAQLEGHAAAADLQQAGETFRSQFARLTEAAESQREALRAAQQEIQEHRRRLQARSVELDCAKGTREALERQLHDVEDRHKEEVIHYQNTIKELENELINCKFDMSAYLREYQDLLNVKMALDVEILSYRKLLCGEEARLSAVSDTSISLPYIYHQSPVYTLPCLGRPGGPRRRAEPQYKFVEEIITETTREIEMSEFEETGSEETEAGKDEGDERDEEDERDEGDERDGGEEGSEQEADRQQDQEGSAGDSVKSGGEDEDENGGSAGEVDDSEQGQRGEEEESEEAEAVDTAGDSGMDKITESKVSLSDGEEREQQEEEADDTKGEEEDAGTKVRVQGALSSKPADLKAEVTVKDEPANGRKDTQADSLASGEGKRPADEASAQASGTQQRSSGGPAPEKKTPDLTAAAEPTPSGETERVSEKGKSGEIENSRAERKETNASEAARGEDNVAKGNVAAKGRGREPSPGSDGRSLPGVEDLKPSSGGKPETGQAVLPEQEITTGAGIKASEQKLPDSLAHTPELTHGSEKTRDPQVKPERDDKSQK